VKKEGKRRGEVEEGHRLQDWFMYIHIALEPCVYEPNINRRKAV
jgi:hypothetical protein